MNPYVFTGQCHLCGGPGPMTMATSNAEWSRLPIYHRSPSTCAYYLEQRKREEKRKQKNEQPYPVAP